LNFLLSPSEVDLKASIGSDGIVSSLPEQKGADILMGTKHGLFGIQRKQVPHDLLKSLLDGRLIRELGMLQELPLKLLVCEGEFKFWNDGSVVVPGIPKNTYKFNRKTINSLILSIMFVRSVPVIFTKDLEATKSFLYDASSFMAAEKHVGLYTRPNLQPQWGTPTENETSSWILQGLSGIGPGLADSILSKFGGMLPIGWICSKEELSEVEGIGETRLKKLWEALPASDFIERK